MSFFRHASFSIVTVIVFLALAAIASYLYSGSPDKSADIDESRLWQKISNSWEAAKYKGFFMGGSSEFNTDNDSAGSSNLSWLDRWEGLKDRFRKEWEQSGQKEDFTYQAGQIDLGPEAEAALENLRSFHWQTKASGLEIFFNAPSGREFRLEIPYKFWLLYF